MVVSRRFLSADLAAITPGFPSTFKTSKIWKINQSVQVTTYTEIFNQTGKFALVRLSSYHTVADAKNGHTFQIYVDGELILTQTNTDYADTDVLEYPIYAKTSLRIMAKARYASIYGRYARAEIMEFA